jgi:hypothetical protein
MNGILVVIAIVAIAFFFEGRIDVGRAEVKPLEPICYDVVGIDDAGTGLSPILINKCTGETWVALRAPYPKDKDGSDGGFSWRWYRLERYSPENAIEVVK